MGGGDKQTRLFLRKLKLDLSEADRTVLLDVLAGPPQNGAGARNDGGRGERSETGEKGRDKKSKKGRMGRHDDGSSDGGDDGGVGGDDGVVLYRDILELMLAERVCYLFV